MKERPILFSAPMVRAILDGSKIQTRRVVKLWNPPELKTHIIPPDLAYLPDFNCYRSTCPYGQIGDRLWVRENFYLTDDGDNDRAIYAADEQAVRDHIENIRNIQGAHILPDTWAKPHLKQRPSIHMPRWASRITLEITDVRVERLQDISEADASAEGCPLPVEQRRLYVDRDDTALGWFRQLWKGINGPESWDANQWVWVIGFKRVEGGAA